MAKKRKPLSEEQKQVLRERLAKARAAKTNTPQQTEEPQKPEPKADTITQDDYADLVRQIQELKQGWQQPPQVQDQSVRLQGGRLIGTVEKYDLSASVYPNPIKRLALEDRLLRFAFDQNYDLNFDVSVSEYTTIDGIRTKEPKFTLELVGRIYNEETGELTNGRYIICRLIMHEDPEAALVIAREQKLEVDEENEEAFLNEMRYIRMRDWLVKCFYPELPKANNRKKEMVVGGKIVEYYEITAEESEETRIPFDKLNKARML